MTARKERLLELYGDDHPAFGSYLECMTRANFTGLAAFTIAFSCCYITQTLIKKKLPYTSKYFFLSSAIAGAFASYKVVKSRSLICQTAWLAAEDKHTYFTELEKRSET